MTKVERLEKEVQSLEQTELEAFREWFYEYDSEKWDKQIESDVCSGRLDNIAGKSLAEHRDGRSKNL